MTVLGLDEDKLRKLMALHPDEKSITNFNRFNELNDTVDKTKAKAYYDALEGRPLPPPRVAIKIYRLLRDLIIQGSFEIDTILFLNC